MEKQQVIVEEMIPFSFCDEIEEEIMLRLPCKSLIRFMCVSKLWKNRITSSEFAYRHSKRQPNNNLNLNLMLQSTHGPFRSLSYFGNQLNDDAMAISLNQPLLEEDDSDGPNKKRNRYQIHGSCDGFLLVVVGTGDVDSHLDSDLVIYIWNPTTGEYNILPKVLACTPEKPIDPYGIVYGFGRDSTTDNNYKVLLLQTVLGDLGLQFKVQLYTTHTNSWKSLPNILFHYSTSDPMKLAYANLHYIAETENLELDPEVIISFDLKDEKFRVLDPKFKDYTSDDDGNLMGLGAFNGHLCALIASNDFLKYTFWTMENFGLGKEEEHWTKFVCINSHQVMGKSLEFESILHVFEDGQILFNARTKEPKPNETYIIETYIVCYLTVNETARILYQVKPTICVSPVVYVQNLVSPNSASAADEIEKQPGQLKRRRMCTQEALSSTTS